MMEETWKLSKDGRHRRGFSLEEIIKRKPKISRLTPICFNGIVIKPDGKERRKIDCICDCGTKTNVLVGAFLNGTTRSCGCILREKNIKRLKKFTHTITRLRASYAAMISRCYNPKDVGYVRYGGNGVIVCEEWKNSYQKFLDWSLENGWAKGLQLDKDTKGNGKLYSPETCCWLTAFENMCHRSISRKYEYKGQLLTLGQIARIEGLTYEPLRKKIRYFTLEEAVNKLKSIA